MRDRSGSSADLRLLARAGLCGVVGAAVVLGGATALAGDGRVSWDRTTLQDASKAILQDASFAGSRVAVVWSEPRRRSFVRTSTTAGDAFAGRELVASSSRQTDLDICGDDLYVSYARDHVNRRRIDVATREMKATGFARAPVSFGNGPARDPEVACAGGRLFVSWLQRVGSRFKLHVDHARRTDLRSGFGGSFQNLGRVARGFGSRPLEPVMAGVKDRAYIAWPKGGAPGFGDYIMFDRWSVGSGPGYAVNDLSGRRLGKGFDPVIAAIGNKVVVAWGKSSRRFFQPLLKIRVSQDRGASFEPTRTIEIPAAAAGLDSVAIAPDGSRIVLAYTIGFEEEPQTPDDERMLSTTDDFETYKDKALLADRDGFVLGIVRVEGRDTLAAAADKGVRRIIFLRQQ